MLTRKYTKLGSYDEAKITLELLFWTPEDVSKWDGDKIDFSFLLSKDKDKDKIKCPIKNVDCYLWRIPLLPAVVLCSDMTVKWIHFSYLNITSNVE